MKTHLVWAGLTWAALVWGPTLSAQPWGGEGEFSDRPARSGEIVAVGRSATLHSNDVARTVVCLWGNADIDGTVRQDAVVIFGSAHVNGNVRGQLVSIFSDTEVGPSAEIHRGLVAVGGKLRRDPSARIVGENVEVLLNEKSPHLQWVGGWLAHGIMLGRPLAPRVPGIWGFVGVLAAAYLLVAVLLPRPLQACATGLVQRPLASFLIGTLGWIALSPIVFLLAISVAGVLVIPFLLLSLVVALFLGKAAIFRVAGEQIGALLHLSFLQNSIMAVLVGGVLFFFMYTVPVLGFIVWGLATIWALGAVLLSIFRSVEAKPVPAVVVPASPLVATTAAATATPGMSMGGPVTGAASLGVMGVAAGASPSGAAAAELGVPPGGTASAVSAPPTISSMEAVALPRAGFWIRLVAAFLDWLLIAFVTLFHARPPMFLLLVIAYHVTMWTWKSTTLGGIVLGLKVVRLDGRPVDFSIALVRSLSSLFSAAALFLGFFWAAWDPHKQSWHDKIAGTVIAKAGRMAPLI